MLMKMLLQKSDNPPKWMPKILRYRDIPWILRYYDIPDIPWFFWCINYFPWWVERFILWMFRSGRLHQKPESSKWSLVHGSLGVSKKNTSNPPCCIWKPSLPIHILRQRFVVKFGGRLDLRKKTSASCTKAPCVWRKNPLEIFEWDQWSYFFVFQSITLPETNIPKGKYIHFQGLCPCWFQGGPFYGMDCFGTLLVSVSMHRISKFQRDGISGT